MADRDQAIEAGARYLAAKAGFDLDNLRSANPREDLTAWRQNWINHAAGALDAMEAIVREDERRKAADEASAAIIAQARTWLNNEAITQDQERLLLAAARVARETGGVQ